MHDRVLRHATLAALLFGACEQVPHELGSLDAGFDAGTSPSFLVPPPEPIVCDGTGHVALSDTCPAVPPSDRSQCPNELETCDYSSDSGINSCVCLWTASGTKRWQCGGVAEDRRGCPTVSPSEGDSCSVAQSCIYVGRPFCDCPAAPIDRGQRCTCGEDLKWHCSPGYTPAGAIPAGECMATPGSGMDPTRRVADLASEEAVSWCSWLVHNVPATTALDPPLPLVSGNEATSSSTFGGETCWFPLPHDLCAENLKLDPCQATLEMLEDCVWTSAGRFRGRGCGPFLLAPGCSRTVVQARRTDRSCRVPIQ